MCGLECVRCYGCVVWSESGVMDVWFGVCVRCDGCVVWSVCQV